MQCPSCSGKKQFIDEPGKLIYTCGSTSGKCGAQMIIDLAQYMYYPDMKESSHSILKSYMDLNQLKDIFSSDEIKEQETMLQVNDQILKKCEKSFSQQNQLKANQTLIQKTHRDRMNLKKDQNLLMDQIKSEKDADKKTSLMSEYIQLNKRIKDEYNELLESNKEIHTK